MKQLVEKIKNAIKGTEFEGKSFIAGGFVRDQAMGNASKDIDICVELPDGGIRLAEFLTKQLHGTSVVIFERFGTAQVVIDNEAIEFVHTRKEVYTPGSRKPETCFGTIEDDVYRRDFTINSLLLNISTGEMLDLTGNGLFDIEAGLIQTTSNPAGIFAEDPLRMLRACRFAAKLDFQIEWNTFKAITNDAHTIRDISKERITEELMKILVSKNPVKGLELMIESGLMTFILPELVLTVGMQQNAFHSKDVFGHICDVIEASQPTAMHRLAAFLHDIGKVNCRTIDENGVAHFYGHENESAIIAYRFMFEHKFSNDQIELVVTAVREHMMLNKGCATKTLRRKRMELGDEKWNFLLDLCEADRASHVDPDFSEINAARTLTAAEKPIIKDKLPLSGSDIMELFNLKPGREVGEKLALVREWVLEDPSLDQGKLIEKLKANV